MQVLSLVRGQSNLRTPWRSPNWREHPRSCLVHLPLLTPPFWRELVARARTRVSIHARALPGTPAIHVGAQRWVGREELRELGHLASHALRALRSAATLMLDVTTWQTST